MTQNSCLGYVPSGYNYIINPCFEVNQRGVASVNTTDAYPVDRWTTSIINTQITASQQAFTIGQTDVPGEPTNYLRCVVTQSTNANDFGLFFTSIEDVRTLAGQTATLSFWAKASSVLSVGLEFIQNFGSNGSANVNFIGTNKITLSTSWTKYTALINIPSITGKTVGVSSYLRLKLWLCSGSDYSIQSSGIGQQSGTFEFANIKLESGSVATPFVKPTFAEELQKCMRYYQILPIHYGDGTTLAINTRRGMFTYPVRMRVNPTTILTVQVYNGATWVNPTLTLVMGNEYGGRIHVNYTSNFYFVGHGTTQFANIFETGKLEAIAEL